MTWIATIAPDEARGRLKKTYERIAGPDGQIDNILLAHSLRPHGLDGHLALYKAALHHAGNSVESWMLETVGVAVSLANGCAYCVDHHTAGLGRVLGDADRAADIRRALEAERPEVALEGKALAAVRYALKLTRTPAEMRKSDLEALRAAGLDDGECLEINQVAAYFAYANRTALGLGVAPEEEALGLAPRNAEDSADWRHG